MSDPIWPRPIAFTVVRRSNLDGMACGGCVRRTEPLNEVSTRYVVVGYFCNDCLRSLGAAMPGKRATDLDAGHAEHGYFRERLGRRVREEWVTYCRETGDEKPSHLAGWDDITDWDREVDRRIAVGVVDEWETILEEGSRENESHG